MKKEIKFSLVYRDMWQSSGKYQPRVDQLVRIAPLIIEMGCFCCTVRILTKPDALLPNLSMK